MLQASNTKPNIFAARPGKLIAQVTGSLSGTGNSSAAAANLTTIGTADWTHWGDTTNVATVSRKTGVTALISNYTKIGAGTVARYTNDPRPLSWTGGTPTATGTNNLTGVYISGVGSGFSFTVPADTTTRTLTVYVGGWNSTGTLTVSLSDGSAANFTDVAPAAAGQYDRNYVLTYSAASAGQTLTVRWTMSAGAGNVTLNGAALAVSGGTTVAVTGVSVSPTSASVAVNATTQLTATVAPANATNKTVTWTSSAPAIATVSASGLVTGIAAGTATITATTQDGGFTATSAITVTATTVAVTGVSVSPTSASVAVNATTQLTATVAPANATNKTVTWTSSAPAIATVSASGLVTGIAAGTATITATTQDGGFTATSAITVTATTVAVTGVSVSPTSASVAVNATTQLTATVAPANATNKTVTWTSSAPAIATVSASGLVTGIAAGTATITATTQDGGFTATSAITVTATTVAVTGVSVSPTSASVAVNATTQLTATVAPANATNKTVTWTSSAPAIATVSASGLVTGIAAGTATITATTQDGGFTATSTITVTATTGGGGSLSGTGNSSAVAANLTTIGTADWTHWGDTTNVATVSRKTGVTALISNYTKIGAGTVARYTNDPRPLSWTGGTPTATGTNNLTGVYISGVGSGFSFTVPADTTTRTLTVYVGGWNSTGTLTVSLSDGSAANFTDVAPAAAGQYDRNYVLTYSAASAGQTLTVRWTMSAGAGNVTLNGAALAVSGGTTVAVTGVSVSPTSASVAVNATTQLTATVAPANATNKTVTWTSSAPAVATVSASGLVTGIAAGTATITATTQDGGFTATSAITVTAGSGGVAVTGVSITPTSASIAVGVTTQLTATVTPTNATNPTVTWSSSASAIATVSASGLVTGIAAGTTTITATTQDGGFTATSAITVTGTTATATWTTLSYTAPILPMHASLLRTGKIFYFCGSGNEAARVGNPYVSVILDINTGTFTNIPVPLDTTGLPIDLFCAGHSFLTDGRLVIASGTIQYDPFYGTKTTFLLDPVTGQLSRVADLNFGRWYPTLVTLGDGRVFAVSGFDVNGALVTQPEIYNPATSTWTNYSTASSAFGLYAHLFLMANGKIFYSGGNAFGDYGVTPRILTLPAQFNQTIAETPVPGLQNLASTNQAASLLLPPAQDQKVMIIGGGNGSGVATNRVNIVDLKAANPAYVAGPSTTYARLHHSAVILPDRTVFVCNGSRNEEDTANSRLPSEIYNPATNTWTVTASQPVARVYHSAALLLPDGRVLASGGNPNRGVNELRLEIYTPQYYSQPRPVIQTASQTVTYGGTITIQTPDAGTIKWVNLIRPMSTTHSVETEQRLVDVPFTIQGNSLTATVTTNPNLAPPGYYMLSIVNTGNVPSVATWIQLQ